MGKNHHLYLFTSFPPVIAVTIIPVKENNVEKSNRWNCNKSNVQYGCMVTVVNTDILM
jgi:hypothetical protein